ncbi:MAG: alpha-galactosidase, partial [Verrucomicrobiales bacterium]|nr:alpha-galactosidase [Verrucomicrobiales bacterium]
MNTLPRFAGRTLLLLLGLCGEPGTVARAADPLVVSETGRILTLDSRALLLELESAPDGAVLLRSLRRAASGHDWAAKGAPIGINLSSDLIALTGFSAGGGFEHAGHSHRATPRGGTELRIDLEHRASKLLATLLITAFPNSPIIDLCLRLHNSGEVPLRNVSRFDPLSIALPAPARPYQVHWVTRNSYALHQAEVRDELTVDGGNWNGPSAAGWLAMREQSSNEFLIAGIEWERHWAFELRRENDGKALRLSAGLRRACTQDLAPGTSLESPHVFLGLAQGDLDDAANTTRDYLLAHVLPPLPAGFPFVCYDIWSTEQENVERRILDEARFAAEKLGVEVFYHDASWYRDSDVAGKERWGVGLGGYKEDRRKLPGGLRHMSDVVHGLGMKFGLWVCPEMVDVTVMEREGIPNEWMTAANGALNVQNIGGWNPMKMLCTGNPAVEQHLRKQLLRITEE